LHHYQPQHYETLLAEKAARLNALLYHVDTGAAPVEVFASPRSHFRMRAEFRIWHTGNECQYVMFIPGQKASAKTRIVIVDFPIVHSRIAQAMPALLAEVNHHPVLSHKLFQVEFLATLSGELLITLIYHKRLGDDWCQAAKLIEKRLAAKVIGRSRKQKIVLSEDFVTETLSVRQGTQSKRWQYRQVEGCFTQPNATVCEKMLAWIGAVAAEVSVGNQHDLLEIYCGNGNFTLPLSLYYHRVLATEVSKSAVAAARSNVNDNGIENIDIARLSAQEFIQAFDRIRIFNRLKQQDIDLDDYQFSTVFVDPPRAGIDVKTLQLIARFDHIIYISCNPETLADNLKVLCETHVIVRTALFDQFPYTDKIESGVWLRTMGR